MRTLPLYLALLSLISSCELGSKAISLSSTPSSSSNGTNSTSGTNSSGSGTTTCTNGTHSVLVSWSANREKAVNTTGGGYLVYYSTSTPVNTSTAASVAVPYASGVSAPTSKMVTGLCSGTWHFRIVAYSALHPTGSSASSRSADSSEVSATIP